MCSAVTLENIANLLDKKLEENNFSIINMVRYDINQAIRPLWNEMSNIKMKMSEVQLENDVKFKAEQERMNKLVQHDTDKNKIL